MITAPGTMYLLNPAAGNVMGFGFVIRPTGYRRVTLRATNVSGLVSVRTGADADYGLTSTVDSIPRTLTTTGDVVVNITVTNFSIVLNARTGATQNGGYFVFNPTRCTPAISRATMVSYRNAVVQATSSFTPSGCENVPFSPGFTATPLTPTAGAASGVTASIAVPTADAAIQQAHVHSATIDLPTGTGLNLSVILGTATCSETQLAANSCPAGSKIGTVTINVPPLSAPMVGNIYALTVTPVLNFAYVPVAPGVTATLRGKAESVNNTVRTSLFELPQAPFSDASLTFSSKLIVNPSTCNASSVATASISGYASNTAIAKSAVYACGGNLPPSVSISTPTENQILTTNSASVAFTATDSDGTVAGVTCALAGPTAFAAATCSSPKQYSGLTNGSYTATVTATDNTGASTSMTRNFSVNVAQPDTIPPVVAISSPAADSTITGTNATVAFSVTDASPSSGIVGVLCSLSGPTPKAEVACGSSTSHTFTALTDGYYTATVKAVDGAGNVGLATRAFTISTASFSVSITTPANGATAVSPDFTLAYTVTGATTFTATCTVIDVANNNAVADRHAPCPSGDLFSLIGGNSHQLILMVTANGETQTVTSSFTTAPRPTLEVPIVISGSADAVFTDNRPTISFLQLDRQGYPAATFECALVSGTANPRFSSCGSAQIGTFTPASTLAVGAYTFYVRTTSGSGGSKITSGTQTYPFRVGVFSATSTVGFSTYQAAAHPILNYNLKTPAGQLRTTDMTMPDGMAGSLTAFPTRCTTAAAASESCPVSTRIGTASIIAKVVNIPGGTDLIGDVFITDPYQPGDAAGFSILVYSPQPGALGNVVIPLRVALQKNGSQMRIVAPEVPTTVEQYALYRTARDFFVEDFTMTINGAAGSGFPLLTNPSSCAATTIPQTYTELRGGSAAVASAFQSTGCATVQFAGSLSQTFSSATAATASGVNTTLTLPPNQSTLKRIRIFEPPAYGINNPALGGSADQCAPSSGSGATLTFDPSTCPPQSKVGTMQISTPLLSYPLTGNVYLIAQSPIPRLGVHIVDSVTGIEIRLVGPVVIVPVDPTCTDVDCTQQVNVIFDYSPDTPVTSITLNLNGPARTSSTGATLAGEILTVAQPLDPSCTATSDGRWELQPWTLNAVVTGSFSKTIAGCQ